MAEPRFDRKNLHDADNSLQQVPQGKDTQLKIPNLPF